MLRGLLIGLLVVVVVVGGAIFFLFSNIGKIIKEAVEDVGPRVTQTSVTLSEAEVDVTEGRAALRGLDIGNPKGFETDYAFKLGAISVTIDTGSIGGDTIVIKEIVVDKPAVTYEYDFSAGTSNIETIQKNAESFAAAAGGGGGGSSGGSSSEGPKLVIENLYVRGAEVAVSAKGFAGKKASQTLPEIHLTDIGKDEGGATPAEVAQEVIAAITDKIGGFMAGMDLGKMLDIDIGKTLEGVTKGITEGARDAGKMIEEGMKGVTEGAGGAGDAVKEGVGAAGEKLKKLFK